MIGYYTRNLIRFVTKLTKYNIIHNKNFSPETLLNIIIIYEIALSLYSKGYIDKKEFDNYIENLNIKIKKFIKKSTFKKDFIIKGKVPLVILEYHDILKKEGLLKYDKKNNLYYICLKQIMYNVNNNNDYGKELEK